MKKVSQVGEHKQGITVGNIYEACYETADNIISKICRTSGIIADFNLSSFSDYGDKKEFKKYMKALKKRYGLKGDAWDYIENTTEIYEPIALTMLKIADQKSGIDT